MLAQITAVIRQLDDRLEAVQAKHLVAVTKRQDVMPPDAIRHLESLRPGRAATRATFALSPAHSDPEKMDAFLNWILRRY